MVGSEEGWGWVGSWGLCNVDIVGGWVGSDSWSKGTGWSVIGLSNELSD